MILRLLAIIFLSVPLLACDLIFWKEEEPQYKISASSPNGVYSVRIERRRNEWKKEDSRTWKAFLSFTKGGQQVLNEVVVSGGDSSTNVGFPKSPALSWIQENTFRLGDQGAWSEPHCDVLLVRNDTSKALSHLLVGGSHGEEFFILDMQPGASVKLNAKPEWERGDLRWVSASGRFSDGVEIFDGLSFRLRGPSRGPGHYCLAIEESQIVIRSREFEGSRLKPLTEEQWKKLTEISDKEAKGLATESDREAGRKIRDEQEEIIPRDAKCGAPADVNVGRKFH